ncbi:unnamed protein product [Malus baccata var. baccata]
MTPHYLKMMWARIDFCVLFLRWATISFSQHSDVLRGCSLLLQDADVMWFGDPFPHSDDLQNRPNGGFNYVKSNSRSIAFYKFRYFSRETYPGFHDQDVLNIIEFHPTTISIGLKIKFLDTAYFGGFCEPSKDLNRVCTMHANCCKGLDSKLHDLRIMVQNWKRSVSLPPNLKRYLMLPWVVPHNCSLGSFRHYDAPDRCSTWFARMMKLWFPVLNAEDILVGSEKGPEAPGGRGDRKPYI